MESGKTQNPQKVLMHCLAGRGRTGTALAILNALIALKYQIASLKTDFTKESITKSIRDWLSLSVFSIVRRLREQRRTAVQTSSQYYFIYKFIDAWLMEKNIMKEVEFQGWLEYQEDMTKMNE